MSEEILTSEGMPCVEEGDNQLDSQGMPQERYLTEELQEDMNKMM